jgi:hypothetical protein
MPEITAEEILEELEPEKPVEGNTAETADTAERPAVQVAEGKAPVEFGDDRGIADA